MARTDTVTTTHRKRRYTITRISPRGVADAQQVAYTIPHDKTGERVPVFGHLLPAVFEVNGWRHRVTIQLDADARRDTGITHGVYISRLAIEVGDGMYDNEARLTSTADVRGMPVGVWLDAAAQLCAFRGTAKRYRVEVRGRTIYGGAWTVTTPRAAANGRDALVIEAVGLDAAAPPRLAKTHTGRKTKRADLPVWNSREALDEVARRWREQDADPRVRGGMSLAAWLETVTGRPANTCTQQLTEARRRGMLPRVDRRNAVKKTNDKKRGR